MENNNKEVAIRKKRVNVSMDEWLHKKGKKVAVKNRRSFSALISDLLIEKLKKKGS